MSTLQAADFSPDTHVEPSGEATDSAEDMVAEDVIEEYKVVIVAGTPPPLGLLKKHHFWGPHSYGVGAFCTSQVNAHF